MIILAGWWSKEIHVVVLPTVDEFLGIDIACINYMLVWQQIMSSQSFINVGNSLIIGLRGRGSFDMCDHVWWVVIAGLCQMHLLANPLSLSLLCKKSFGIIGRVDQCSGSGSIREIAPVEFCILPIKIFDPDASQRLDHRNLTQKDWSGIRRKSIKELRPSFSDDAGFKHIFFSFLQA
jgi:hypothetical protein